MVQWTPAKSMDSPKQRSQDSHAIKDQTYPRQVVFDPQKMTIQMLSMAVYGGEPKNDHKHMVEDVQQMGSSYNKTYHTHKNSKNV